MRSRRLPLPPRCVPSPNRYPPSLSRACPVAPSAPCRLSFHSVSRLSQVGGASSGSVGSSAAVGGSRGERVRALSVVISDHPATPHCLQHPIPGAQHAAGGLATKCLLPAITYLYVCRTGLRNRTVQRAMGVGRPHLHSPSLACRVFLIKKTLLQNPIPPKNLNSSKGVGGRARCVCGIWCTKWPPTPL